MKKAVFLFFLLVLVVVGGLTFRGKTESTPALVEKKPISVETRLAGSSRETVLNFSYPGLLKSEKETLVKAKTSGQVAWLNFVVGDQVSGGEILAKIDSSGNLSPGENNFLSNQIRQQEFLVKQAKKNYSLAKKKYQEDDSIVNETAKKIAKLQYQAAQATLQNLINDGLLTAPLDGTIVEKMVSVGDTVTMGQTIAKINQLGKTQVQFFIDEDLIGLVKKGDQVEVELGDEKKILAEISLVSSEADLSSKKFKIEADLLAKDVFPLGSVVTIYLKIQKKAEKDGQFYVPLSAVTIGQNESFIFLAENGQAKKKEIKIEKISGETVLIEADLAEQAAIIVEGNKQVQDGMKITDKN